MHLATQTGDVRELGVRRRAVVLLGSQNGVTPLLTARCMNLSTCVRILAPGSVVYDSYMVAYIQQTR